MVSFLRTTFSAALLLLLAACGSIETGRDFDLSAFQNRIEQGVTTRTQVRSWLGDPTGTGVSLATDGARYEVWSYYFATGKVSDLSAAKTKILQIKFDRQGVVRGYDWSASAP